MKRTLEICSILFLSLFAMQTVASAQAGNDANGLQGIWFAVVTPVNCQTGLAIPNAPVFRGLYMFGHDGSLTNEAAFPVPTPSRSSGLGTWNHAQAQTYNSAFRFFRYNPDNSFLAMRKVSSTIVLQGDQFLSMDTFQDYDANNNPISAVGSSGCNTVIATRQ